MVNILIGSTAGIDIPAGIRAAGSNPRGLEQLYQAAKQSGQAEIFESAIQACCVEAPDNLLYAAWQVRLESEAAEPAKLRRAINWTTAVPLSILTGLIFWALSG